MSISIFIQPHYTFPQAWCLHSIHDVLHAGHVAVPGYKIDGCNQFCQTDLSILFCKNKLSDKRFERETSVRAYRICHARFAICPGKYKTAFNDGNQWIKSRFKQPDAIRYRNKYCNSSHTYFVSLYMRKKMFSFFTFSIFIQCNGSIKLYTAILLFTLWKREQTETFFLKIIPFKLST